MKVFLRDVSARYFSLRGLPVVDVLRANHVPATFIAGKGHLIRHERRADVEAMLEAAGHSVVVLGGERV